MDETGTLNETQSQNLYAPPNKNKNRINNTTCNVSPVLKYALNSPDTLQSFQELAKSLQNHQTSHNPLNGLNSQVVSSEFTIHQLQTAKSFNPLSNQSS